MLENIPLADKAESSKKVELEQSPALPAVSAPLPAKELQIFRDRVLSASSPEALFGELKGESAAKLAMLNRMYFELVNKCHARHYRNDASLLEVAHVSFQRLSELYRIAQDGIRNGTYGESSQAAQAASDTSVIAVVESGQHVYSLRELIAEGDVSFVYRADFKDEKGALQQVCLKIAKDSKDNELMLNEQKILGGLAHVSLPKLLEGFELPDGRVATALSYVKGINLHQLRELPQFSQGLKEDPEYHIGWILERQLAVLGYLHSRGIVHGSVEPAHLIVQGDCHNVFLIDFCWAVKNPKASKHIQIGQDYYSAPEVFEKSIPHPAMDIYGLGKSAVYLLGGDPENGALSETIDPMVTKFIGRMVEDEQKERASDAHQLAYHLLVIRKEFQSKERDFIPLLTTGKKLESLTNNETKMEK